MATYAARRTVDMAQNAAAIVGIEWLAAAQGIDFRRPLKSSAVLEAVHQELRQDVAHYDRDRWFAADIETAKTKILSGSLWKYLEQVSPLSANGGFSTSK